MLIHTKMLRAEQSGSNRLTPACFAEFVTIRRVDSSTLFSEPVRPIATKVVPLDEYHKLMKPEISREYMQMHIIDHYKVVKLDD